MLCSSTVSALIIKFLFLSTCQIHYNPKVQQKVADGGVGRHDLLAAVFTFYCYKFFSILKHTCTHMYVQLNDSLFVFMQLLFVCSQR